MIEYFLDEIIESVMDNTAGSLHTRASISIIVKNIINSHNINKDYVDMLLDRYSPDYGYMVKATDVINVLKEYLISDHNDYGQEQHSEKDLDMIEIIHGDWHSECGDR